MESKRILIVAVNFVALIAIVYWLQGNISLLEVVRLLESLPMNGLLIALVLNVAVLGVYGARLALLLSARRLPALAVVTIGFGMNGVLPLRLGELAKLAYARQYFGISAPRLIAATATEKFLDLCALLLLGLVASQLVVVPYLNRGITVAALLVSGLALMFIVAFQALVRWERSGRQTHNWITDAFDTLLAQRGRARIVHLASLTTTIWLVTVFSVYWMFNSVFPQFSLSHASVLTLVLALAIAIPSAPAGLGVVEAAIVAYLHHALQVAPNQALASALAFHAIVVIPQVLATAMILVGVFWRRRVRGLGCIPPEKPIHIDQSRS